MMQMDRQNEFKTKIAEPYYSSDLELPIGLFAPQSKELFEKKGAEIFHEMKEFGANLCLGTYPQITEKMLDWAEKASMKVLIYNAEVESMSPQNAAEYVRRFKSHPAYYGIQVADEPSIERMEKMSDVCRAIRQEDPEHYLWVDLLPTYADFKTQQQYREYVASYMKYINPNVIVYDHYGIIHQDIRKDFYLNQAIAMEFARRYKVPVWTFDLCSAHGDYEEPTVEQLRWQVSNQLATGSKGIQWFTYGQPDAFFKTPPIDCRGNRTGMFDKVKQVNYEIKSYDHILMSLNHTETVFWDVHNDQSKQYHWKPLAQISGDPAVIGCFQDQNGSLACYVANNSFRKEARISLVFEDCFADCLNIWDSQGKKQCHNSAAVELLPGEGKLIQLLKS